MSNEDVNPRDVTSRDIKLMVSIYLHLSIYVLYLSIFPCDIFENITGFTQGSKSLLEDVKHRHIERYRKGRRKFLMYIDQASTGCLEFYGFICGRDGPGHMMVSV